MKYMHLHKDEESECDQACPDSPDVSDKILLIITVPNWDFDLHQCSPVPEPFARGSANHS